MTQRQNKIACTHPGKHGDCLYALPAVKALAELHNCQVDFYTSSYCAPLKRLFEYQPYIDGFYVAPNYVIERMDMGVQPAYVPVDGSLYAKVYQLGFRRVPDTAIHEFIGQEAGVAVGDITYETPEITDLGEPYIVLAPRGETSYRPLFQELVNQSAIPVCCVGGQGDAAPFYGVHDLTGWDYLETASAISHASAFVGIMSSQLVLANGFPIPKIVPHDGRSWDMRHPVYSEKHHYLVQPTADDILEIINHALLQES
jgi:hypothetical protein